MTGTSLQSSTQDQEVIAYKQTRSSTTIMATCSEKCVSLSMPIKRYNKDIIYAYTYTVHVAGNEKMANLVS